MPICEHYKFKDFSCIVVQTPRENTKEYMFFYYFKKAMSVIKYKRTWINYRIDRAYGKCCSFRGKNVQYGDWEPGTNQGNTWKVKQISSLLIRTRTQGLLWRNHWNHQSGLRRVHRQPGWGNRGRNCTRKGSRGSYQGPKSCGQNHTPRAQRSSLHSSLANGIGQVPAHSSWSHTSETWRQGDTPNGNVLLSLCL